VARGKADFVSESASARSIIAVLAVVAIGHITLMPRVADLDSFYHIGHALAYLEGAVFDTSLPWATQSIIGDMGGDLWWGFHVLLMPFAAIGGVRFGIQLAAVVLTAGLGLTVMWVLRRHGTSYPGVWAALFLVATPNLFYRHLMVRPHVLSLAASLALVSCLVRGRWWQVALLSAFISWAHLNLFWIAPGLVIGYAIVRIPVTVGLGRDAPDTGVPIHQALPAAVVGSLLGWLLRPDPFATLALLNTQLFQLFAQKAAGSPLTFAAELTPVSIEELLRTSWFFAIVWVAAMLLAVAAMTKGRFGRLGQARTTLVFLALAVSAVFLILALASARRAMEQWVAFGSLGIAILWSAYPLPDRRWVRGVIGLVLAAHLSWTAYRHMLNVDLVAYPADTMRDVASFLEDESSRGDIVFHARWDNFGPLFARDRENRYLGGMDPIFQFAHDPEAFWEFFYLSIDATSEWTCDAYPCQDAVAVDTHDSLTNRFGARWVVVEPRRNPRFTLYLLNDERYRLALETPREAVFEVMPASPDGPGLSSGIPTHPPEPPSLDPEGEA
jgi:hypothetical protein